MCEWNGQHLEKESRAREGCGKGNLAEINADKTIANYSDRVADFYDHPVAKNRIKAAWIRSAFEACSGSSIAADHSFVDPNAKCQLGVVDLLVAHFR
jgi:hypothetical protein